MQSLLVRRVAADPCHAWKACPCANTLLRLWPRHARASCECALSDANGTRNMLSSDGLTCSNGDMSKTCGYTVPYHSLAGGTPDGACAPATCPSPPPICRTSFVSTRCSAACPFPADLVVLRLPTTNMFYYCRLY